MIVPVILAAGASSRMGRLKALCDFDGRTCLELALDACREASLAPPIVVLGYQAETIRRLVRFGDATVHSANGVPAATSSAAWRITRNDSSMRALPERHGTARRLVCLRSRTREEQAACVVLGRVHVDQHVRGLAFDVRDLIPGRIDHGSRGRLVGELNEGIAQRRIEEHRVTAPAVMRRYEDAPAAAARPPGGAKETDLGRAHEREVHGIQEERLGAVGEDAHTRLER